MRWSISTITCSLIQSTPIATILNNPPDSRGQRLAVYTDESTQTAIALFTLTDGAGLLLATPVFRFQLISPVREPAALIVGLHSVLVGRHAFSALVPWAGTYAVYVPPCFIFLYFN